MPTLLFYKLPKSVHFECVHARTLFLSARANNFKFKILVLILNVISRAQFSVAFYPLMKKQQPRNVWNLQHLFAQQ